MHRAILGGVCLIGGVWLADGPAPAGDKVAPKAPPKLTWRGKTPDRPTVPAVKTAGWVRNPIDTFVVARLEKDGLTPSPEADRRTLIRRLSFDLTGLPPTPAEIN